MIPLPPISTRTDTPFPFPPLVSSINAHAIDYTRLPPRFARNRPGHGSIPAAFLSMMGGDAGFAGRGHGKVLLTDALLRITRLSREIEIGRAPCRERGCQYVQIPVVASSCKK